MVPTARQRVHNEVRSEIVDAARMQLAVVGAPALSLRAVARELGMASSAIYRYFSSREELITELIIEAYDGMGEVAEEAAATPGNTFDRFAAICRAVRRWSLEHPHEYALIYGTPVPGYVAPSITMGPASRVTMVLAALLATAYAGGTLQTDHCPEISPALDDALREVHAKVLPDVPAAVMSRALQVWVLLFGHISFEVFHRLDEVMASSAVFFDDAIRTMAGLIGIPVTEA